jgi:aspartate/methionine/tyrosine aminotransferase
MNATKEKMQLHYRAVCKALRPTLIRQIFERALPDSINFGLGEPDLPTPRLSEMKRRVKL